MRKALTVIGALGLMTGLAVPAHAADTTTTFTLAAGSLSISAPGTSTLGAGAVGSAATAALGAVTVTDARGALTAAWTATAQSTDFTTGGGTAPETIAASNVSYWSGVVTPTGVAVPVPGQPLALNAVAIDTAKTAASLTAGTGNNTATWTPTLIVNVPAAAVAGTYTGTITHSMA